MVCSFGNQISLGGITSIADALCRGARIVDDAGTPRLQFKFRRPQNHVNLNVIYTFQTSNDLQSDDWVDNTDTPTLTLDGSNEWVTYLVSLPSGGEDRIFCRCNVTIAP